MQINLEKYEINYDVKGDGKRDVILLHGWGQNIQMMSYIADFLSAHFRVFSIDFPGFGESKEPKESYSVDDMTEMLHDFVGKLGINNPILIGHSYGCRVALLYAFKYPVYKMALTGAAGVKPKRGIDYYFRVYTYKAGKLLLKPFKGLSEKLRSKSGSEDYRNASEVMRSTLVKTVNFDITPYLKDINVETLLIFGEKDEATPLYQARILEKQLPNAALVIFEGDDHFAYFHQGDRFNRVLDAYLKADY